MSSTVRSLLVVLVTVLFGLSVFGGCTHIITAAEHSELQIQTRMTNTIFTRPVSPDQRVAWVEVKNTSDKVIDVQGPLTKHLQGKGYRLTEDPNSPETHFHIQANILYVGKDAQTAFQLAQYGVAASAVAGAGGGYAAGYAAGRIIGRSGRAGAVGSLVGAAIFAGGDALLGAALKVNQYYVVIDVQVAQRSDGEVVERQVATLKQGNSAAAFQQKNGTSSWERFRTGVISTASQLRLQFEEVREQFAADIARSLSGLL